MLCFVNATRVTLVFVLFWYQCWGVFMVCVHWICNTTSCIGGGVCSRLWLIFSNQLWYVGEGGVCKKKDPLEIELIEHHTLTNRFMFLRGVYHPERLSRVLLRNIGVKADLLLINSLEKLIQGRIQEIYWEVCGLGGTAQVELFSQSGLQITPSLIWLTTASNGSSRRRGEVVRCVYQ